MSLPVNFHLNIGSIKISMVENASAVNIGKNLLIGWDSHTKTNQGLGNISGDANPLQQMANHVDDPDKIDLNAATLPKDLSTEAINTLAKEFFTGED